MVSFITMPTVACTARAGGKGKAAAAPAAVPAEDDAGSEDSDASGEEDEGDGFDAAAMFKKMDARMKRHVARCQQSMQKLRSGAASGGALAAAAARASALL
jgi:hypothetical protein